MQNYSCKCGYKTGFGSMGFWPCEGCPKCGTVPSINGVMPSAAVPHKFVKKFDQDNGKPYYLCSVCLDRVSEIIAEITEQVIMINIGSISSGLSSAVACDRLLKKYPDTVLVFEDVAFEDDDNYRFLADCEYYWGIKIVQLCDGRNPYEV